MLVGREHERQVIRSLAAGARVGQGGTLVVVGEAGIGKSALLHDAAEDAAAHGMTTLRAQGVVGERDVPFGGLLVDFALSLKATAIIRGLRAFSDFEFEFNMALMNRHLHPSVETIFVMPNEAYSYCSSTLVKQVAKYGGDVSHFVPPNVAEALRQSYKNGPDLNQA